MYVPSANLQCFSSQTCDCGHNLTRPGGGMPLPAHDAPGGYVVHRRAGSPASAVIRLLVILFCITLVAAACGGDDDDSGGDDSGGNGANTTAADDSKPVSGGSVTYGLEAETNGGYCLPEAQLAISGIQVTRTLYDTLAAPDEDGKIQPYLAKSITPNADYTEWTIT